MHADWLVPQWPAPAGVHALCTTRAGGHSVPPFASMNLGEHVGDAPQHVAANRQLLQTALGAQPVFLNQVHGTQALRLNHQSANGQDADAAFTTEAGLACTIMVADCLPVLLCDTQGTQVAAAHAGWRSLAGQDGRGILEVVLESFRALAPVQHAGVAPKMIAWLGPCIGREAFEVGDDVRAAFVAHDPAAQALFQPLAGQQCLADLQGLARLRLHALGVTHIYGNDGSRAWCTVSQASRFFSYRRDRVSGRMAASIWRD